MQPPAPATRWIGVLCLLITTTGWALGWSVTKIMLRDWPPLFSRGVTGIAAAALLAVAALAAGERLAVPRPAIRRLAFAAFTNVFAWMGFSMLTLNWLNIGESVLLVFTMPLWAMLLAWPVRGTRPTPRAILALTLGLAGVVVLLSRYGLAFTPEKTLGVLFALAAAILFALGTVLNGKPLPLPRIASVMWQVLLGCIPLLLLGLAFENPDPYALSPMGMLMFAYVITIGMGLCYLTWFAALRHLPPAMAATGTLLVPLLGVLSGALFFGEPIGPREAAAVILTLGGVALALWKT